MKSTMPVLSGLKTLPLLLRWCARYFIKECGVCLPYDYCAIQASPATAEPFVPQQGVIEQNEMFNFALKSAPSVLYSKYKQFGQVCLALPTINVTAPDFEFLVAWGVGLVCRIQRADRCA